jgi:hypothetical protein
MILRANVTTTYPKANVNPPRADKTVQLVTSRPSGKKAADQIVPESEGTRNLRQPATKTPSLGSVPLTEHGENRSSVRNSGQKPASLDVLENSSPEDESMVLRGPSADRPASDSYHGAGESEAALKSVPAGYGFDSGKRITKGTFEESPAVRKYFPMSTDGRPAATESLGQSLPSAALPTIRLTEPSAKAATASPVAGLSSGDIAPPCISEEDTMLSELTAALRFGQVQENSAQTDPATGGDVAKHLQSEGVFGISANGRNLGTIDFIRQKQFEYTMDQKPFTTDDLLLEAEKAINGTLNSDQSSAVSKSLLQAAESVNAYRNQSVKSSERAEIAAKPSRVAASKGKEEA